MKISKVVVPLILILSTLTISFAQVETDSEEHLIEPSDIQKMLGNWVGTFIGKGLSYKTWPLMPCELTVTSKKENRLLKTIFNFPDYPELRNKERFKISKNRKWIGGDRVISRLERNDGVVEIITDYIESGSIDKTKKRYVYLIGERIFIIGLDFWDYDFNAWDRQGEYYFTKSGS